MPTAVLLVLAVVCAVSSALPVQHKRQGLLLHEEKDAQQKKTAAAAAAGHKLGQKQLDDDFDSWDTDVDNDLVQLQDWLPEDLRELAAAKRSATAAKKPHEVKKDLSDEDTDELQDWLPDKVRKLVDAKRSAAAGKEKHNSKKDFSDEDPLLQLFESDSEDSHEVEDRDYGNLFGFGRGGRTLEERDYGNLFGFGNGGRELPAQRRSEASGLMERGRRWMEAIGLGNYGSSSNNSPYGGHDNDN